MKKTSLVLFLGLFFAVQANAQDNKLTLSAETRIDYQREYLDGEAIHGTSGFKGKFLNVRVDGDITDNLSFSYRQRLNKAHADASFFDATDWITLTWKAAENWELSAGKQIVGVGGYEYDRAPIDLYIASEYWNNIACYQLGASAAYDLNGGKDKLLFQFCESPFSKIRNIGDINTGNYSDMYAYNLMWYGSHGCLNTIYSVNMMEYMPGKYISYVALGHRLECGKLALELDFMNRAASHQTYFFKDCSVMAELQYKPSDKLNLFAKASYDVNNTDGIADFSVLPGTEVTLFGAGLEYYPLKNDRSLRLHAVGSYAFGKNGNAAGCLADRQTMVDVGLKWKVRIL